MSIKQQIEAAKARLAELEAAVAAGDAEAIEAAEGILAEIAELERKAAEAERKAGVLAALKAAAPVPADRDKPARTLGEWAAKNLNLDVVRAGGVSRTGYGFKATDAHLSLPVPTVATRIVDPEPRPTLRDAFGEITIGGNYYEYIQMGATELVDKEESPFVLEGAAKPEINTAYEPKTTGLGKIAAWWYETDELLADNAMLASVLNTRGRAFVAKKEEEAIATALLGTTGLGTITKAPDADTIFEGIMQVKADTGWDADAIVMNPADYQTLRLAKDGNSQYYGGGYMYGPYGQGNVQPVVGIWGLPVYLTTEVAEGTVLVGAFKNATAIVTKQGEGVSVEVHRGDHDDAINNRVTVVVEERLGVAVFAPAGVVVIAEE